ncbi:MAG: large subunit ribosomal protein L25 [Alphaproteobacteria bacterium]|jgi:large subunit ribosomal protein L25
MSDVYVMEAQVRENGGKGIARRLRNEGMVPAVVYGSGKEPKKVAVTAHSLKMAIQHGGFLTSAQELLIEGKTELVLPREIQCDPVSDKITHVDFLRYDAKRMVKATVRIEMTGHDKSEGVKAGGIASLQRSEVELLCRADSIPNILYVSLEGLNVGEAVKFSSITLPDGVEPAIADRDFTVASILSSRTTKTDEDDADDAATADGDAEGESVEGAEAETKSED